MEQTQTFSLQDLSSMGPRASLLRVYCSRKAVHIGEPRGAHSFRGLTVNFFPGKLASWRFLRVKKLSSTPDGGS